MKALKITSIILSAVILTTLAIDASDTLTGKGGTLLAQLSGIEKKACPEGMVNVLSALTFTCVDEFEASVGKECIIAKPESQINTEVNLSQKECFSESVSDQEPWSHVTREQAVVICAKSGKRLPSAYEWYQYSLGTEESKCNINSSSVAVGNKYILCSSAVGVKNAVGNVWEWVSDDVIDGVYQNRKLPETGYVAQVDSAGLATVTISDDDSVGDSLGGYFWSNATGTYAIIRGGFYGSRSDAGVYNAHTYTSPNFASAGIGFRCVR